MKAFSVFDLRPAGKSAVAIQAAIDAAKTKRIEFAADLAAAGQRNGELLASGTRADYEANRTIISGSAERLVEIDDFIETHERLLTDAVKSERIAALQAELAAIDFEAKCAAFVTAWQKDYAAAAKAIVGILELEAEADDARAKAERVRRQLIAEGVQMPDLVKPAGQAVGGVLTAQSIGSIVQLPGLLGAPNIPVDNSTRAVPRMVQRPDWQANGPRDHTNKPLTMKWVEEIERVHDVKPARVDQPFWWNGRSRQSPVAKPIAVDEASDDGLDDEREQAA